MYFWILFLVPQFHFHISDAEDDDANVGIKLSEWLIFFISTEVFFISWSWFVFLALANISSLHQQIQYYSHDDDDGDVVNY